METKLLNVRRMFDDLCNTSYDTDYFGVHEMLLDIAKANVEVMLQFKRIVIPQIHTMATSFDSVKQDLEKAKQELLAKEEELKNSKQCLKCPSLEREIASMKKKQAVNEMRIKSIAKILLRHDSTSQDLQESHSEDDTDSDQSTVTKAYNLVSQMLGCAPIYEENDKSKFKQKQNEKRSPLSARNHDHRTPEKRTNDLNEILKTDGEGEETEDDILVCSLEEVDENLVDAFRSPKCGNERNKTDESPVLGKFKETRLRSDSRSPQNASCKRKLQNEELDEDLENSFYIAPSPENFRNPRNPIISGSIKHIDKNNVLSRTQKKVKSVEDKNKNKADFWQLKLSNIVDDCNVSSKKEGAKLKQAKLSLGFFPKKVMLSDLQEFNGGIRKSQTSTQLSEEKSKECNSSKLKIHKPLRNADEGDDLRDDDIVVDSPMPDTSSSKRKGKRLFNLGRKLSYNSSADNESGISQLKKTSSHPSEVQKTILSNDQRISEEVKEADESFDCIKKTTLSPNYKYRNKPVRKKAERQQLPGWDCENCRKYFEIAAGDNVSEEELKKLMNCCSRHRDKNPVRPRTPPGFWDAEFPATLDMEATYNDVLPTLKKTKRNQ